MSGSRKCLCHRGRNSFGKTGPRELSVIERCKFYNVTFTTRTATRTLREKKQQQSRIFFWLNFDVYVVVQFYPWFKNYFLLFLGMVMHDNEFQTKEKQLNQERLLFVRKFRWKKYREMVLVYFFWHLKQDWLVPLNFSLSLDMKPDTSKPNKWHRTFRSFR